MKAYAESKTPEEDRDKRQTPISVFQRIEEITGFIFCRDVCAEPHTAKVAGSYWTIDDDSLSLDWAAETKIPDYSFHTSLWMNPPYSDPATWCKKAAEEAAKGLIIVGLLPDDRSTKWYQEYIEDKAQIVYIPNKRISFEDGDKNPQRGNPKGSIFPVWTPMYFDKTQYVRFDL